MISKQKAFKKSFPDENTPWIFLNETHANVMDPDDLRKFFLLHRVLQGFKNSYKPMQWIALSGHVVSKERQKTSLLPKDIDEEERD